MPGGVTTRTVTRMGLTTRSWAGRVVEVVTGLTLVEREMVFM